jgi:predicted Zn-ribbon and HTH transcriptional regulator
VLGGWSVFALAVGDHAGIRQVGTGERIADDIGRWVALSERFADEGEMNLSKLLEAAAYAHVRRAGWLHRPLVTKATMAQELETSIDRLEALGADGDLIVALKLGSEKLARQEHRDLLVDESPDVFVCRTCGHLASRQPPAHCPDCGSWPGRFRRFVPVFNADNAEPTNPLAVLALLASNADDLESLVGDLPEEICVRRPGPNVWSLREHVAHFYDAQETLDNRIDRMLADDDPDLAVLSMFELASQEELHPATTADMLVAFLRKRASCVARLEARPLGDLWRTGRHAEFGRITIIRQANYMACHEQTHLPDIEQLRQEFAPSGVS